MPPPVTDTQLANRLNPTPVSVAMPGDGQVFRGVGGNIYKASGSTFSQLSAPNMATANTDLYAADGSIIKAGTNFDTSTIQNTAFPNVNRNFNGKLYQSLPLSAAYDAQYGAGAFEKLPQYIEGDLTSIGKFTNSGSNTDISHFNPASTNSATTTATANNTPNSLAPSVNPGVDPAKVGPAANGGIQPVANNGGAPAATGSEIPTHLPGGTATTLYDYFASKGQTLPSVSDRSSTFQQLGLGSAADYKGTAQQNEDMLSALQRKDYATTTIGSPTSSASAGMNSTPAGTSLSTALAGGDAATAIANYKTFLSTQLGVASANVTSSENALNSFFSTEKDPTSILNDAIDSAGVTESRGILATLDKTIADQSATLAKLPDDIRTTLADVGVSQAQLERLVTAETKAPDAALKSLMTERNALSSEIDKATTFAEKFANTKIAGQAAKLAALEWQVTSAKGDYNTLSTDAKAVITQAVSDKKSIMTTALTAAKNGASADVVDAILAAGSGAEALQIAGPTMVTPKKTAASGTAAGAPVTSGSIVMSQGDITAGQNALKASASQGAEADNKYADPGLYLNMYKHWIGAGGKEADFFKNYPYTTYVNPSNTWLTQSMSDFNKQSSGSSGGGGAQTP